MIPRDSTGQPWRQVRPAKRTAACRLQQVTCKTLIKQVGFPGSLGLGWPALGADKAGQKKLRHYICSRQVRKGKRFSCYMFCGNPKGTVEECLQHNEGTDKVSKHHKEPIVAWGFSRTIWKSHRNVTKLHIGNFLVSWELLRFWLDFARFLVDSAMILMQNTHNLTK